MKILENIDCRVGQLFGNPDPKYVGVTGNGMHNGIDYPFPSETPLKCVLAGVVEYAGEDSSAGRGIYIISDLKEKGAFRTIYWHMKSFSVKVGDKVNLGDIIGLSDNTGFSTGPHLHFGLKKVKFNGKFWDNIDENDGFSGAVDPFPYFSEVIYPVIKEGMIGQFVFQIQTMLNKKTGAGLVIDGKYGPKTRKAVQDFQKKYILSPDGMVGSLTMNKLNNL